MVFPIAHHDGNYFADAATLDRLEGEGARGRSAMSATPTARRAISPASCPRTAACLA